MLEDKQIIIDVTQCPYYKEDKTCTYLPYKSKCEGDCNWTAYKEMEEQLKAKEQECEELKKELHKNFEEKDTLHLIIDRLLEASGYDANTATAEDFEDVYEYMRYEQQQLDQLKAENDELKKANIHIDNNRMVKDDKLKRIEDLIIACSSGYTDEFIQELLVILHEPEPCFKSKLSKTLTEIKEIAENAAKCLYVTKSDDYTDGYRWLGSIILQKISEVEDGV